MWEGVVAKRSDSCTPADENVPRPLLVLNVFPLTVAPLRDRTNRAIWAKLKNVGIFHPDFVTFVDGRW
jgi:hypothetical protein